jgi:hypothetical protein
MCVQANRLAAMDYLLACLVDNAARGIGHVQAAKRSDRVVVAHDLVSPRSYRNVARFEDVLQRLSAIGTGDLSDMFV